MSGPIIKVEQLGKRYRIHHRRPERYRTLRDAVAGGFSHLLHPPSPTLNPQSSDEDFWALKDVSFEVKQGEVIGIIGRNGAGKSTLLKILSRITEPTEGRITLRGRVSSLLEVGTGFHPELTGRENIFLNGAILGMNKAEIRAKFDEIVAFAEVERFLDTPVKHYSSGMHVRLAFAVAAHLDPEILIVDEVLAVGDAEFQKKCLGKMDDAARSGRTVLLVSHSMAVVNHLCKRAVVLSHGRMAFDGAVAEAITAYRNLQETKAVTILDHLASTAEGLKVTHATVNGSDLSPVHIDAANEPLHLEIGFEVTYPTKVSLQAFLNDMQGNRLGFYSPGHMKNEHVATVQPGRYTAFGEMVLPTLNKGRYFLDLGISEPGQKMLAELPNAVELEVAGRPTMTGVVFEQDSACGFLTLDGSVKISSAPHENRRKAPDFESF